MMEASVWQASQLLGVPRHHGNIERIKADLTEVATILRRATVSGEGVGRGKDRAVEAALQAIQSVRDKGGAVDQAEGLLITITASGTLTMIEIDEAVSVIYHVFSSETMIVFGVNIEETLGDELRMTLQVAGPAATKASKNKNAEPSDRLSELAGTWSPEEEKEFLDAIQPFETIDSSLWK